MYVESGLGSYRSRSGLAGGQMVNGVYVTDAPITTDTVFGSGANVYEDSTGTVIGTGAPSSSLTSWLNQNSTMVMVGVAGFVALLLFAKAGR